MSHTTGKQVDSFRFVSFMVRKLMLGWSPRQPVLEIPWTPLVKPLKECRVALISTAALATPDDLPYDQEGEQDRPWWGDPGFRRISRGTRQVRSYHLHINTRYAEEDLNSVFPLHRLIEMETEGRIGSVAETHFSFMGYLPDFGEFLQQSMPKILDRLRDERVDIVLLVPV